MTQVKEGERGLVGAKGGYCKKYLDFGWVSWYCDQDPKPIIWIYYVTLLHSFFTKPLIILSLALGCISKYIVKYHKVKFLFMLSLISICHLSLSFYIYIYIDA
jgi:hypothetical protein